MDHDPSQPPVEGVGAAARRGSREGEVEQERFVRVAKAEGAPIYLGCEPLVESWDRVDGAAQQRLAAYRADLLRLMGPRLAALEGPVALRLVVGAERRRAGDLDNFLTPVAKALADARVCSYRAERDDAAPSGLVLGPARRLPKDAETGWSFRAARTRSSAETEAWKREVADAVGHHADAHADDPLEVELGLRVLSTRRTYGASSPDASETGTARSRRSTTVATRYPTASDATIQIPIAMGPLVGPAAPRPSKKNTERSGVGRPAWDATMDVARDALRELQRPEMARERTADVERGRSRAR